MRASPSGCFDSHERIWEEPLYRNLFGYLREFGDAEVASLIAPRGLVVEYSEFPAVNGPPAVREWPPRRRGPGQTGHAAVRHGAWRNSSAFRRSSHGRPGRRLIRGRATTSRFRSARRRHWKNLPACSRSSGALRVSEKLAD